MTLNSAGMWGKLRRLFAPAEVPSAPTFAIAKPTEHWRRELTPDQFYVLRGHGTERPGSSRLLKEARPGTYCCAGCGEAVYSSDAKFDSGSGWPSFARPVDTKVETRIDRSMLMSRTEVHCANCGGHLGHRFEDGPGPAGMRHCINGCALTFDPT